MPYALNCDFEHAKMIFITRKIYVQLPHVLLIDHVTLSPDVLAKTYTEFTNNNPTLYHLYSGSLISYYDPQCKFTVIGHFEHGKWDFTL